MRRLSMALGLALCMAITAHAQAQAQTQTQPPPAQSTVPEIAFEAVPDFLQLPGDIYFGEVAGVAVNSKRHVFVLSRGNSTGPAYAAAAAQLLEFDAHGKFVREIGHNL